MEEVKGVGVPGNKRQLIPPPVRMAAHDLQAIHSPQIYLDRGPRK